MACPDLTARTVVISGERLCTDMPGLIQCTDPLWRVRHVPAASRLVHHRRPSRRRSILYL